MRQVGILATGVAVLVALAVAAMTARSYPDIRRYLKMRAM